jgi:hypothetical protein
MNSRERRRYGEVDVKNREVLPLLAAIVLTIAVALFGLTGVSLAPDGYVPPGPRPITPTFDIEEVH